MAWHFLKSGLLMPAAVPMDLADVAFTEGKYDFQVRGRVESHLRTFMDDYMKPGTFHDEIQKTPNMDYNVRFYTTREAYADAIRLTILEIDYEKFKPMAEERKANGSLRYPGGKEYHSVLNGIWSTVTRLGSPGGYWGTAAAYKSSTYKGNKFTGNRHTKRGSDYVPDAALNLYKGTGRRVGDTFFSEEFDFDAFYNDHDANAPLVGYDDDAENWDMDYTPVRTEEENEIIAKMSGIPIDQWGDYLDEHDLGIISSFIEEALSAENRTLKLLGLDEFGNELPDSDLDYFQDLIVQESTEVTVSRKAARKERRANKRRKRQLGRHNVRFSG